MDFKLENRQVVEIVLINDLVSGYDEISPFFNVLDKLQKDSTKAGFVRKYTKTERAIIQALWEKRNEYAKPSGEEDSRPSVKKI